MASTLLLKVFLTDGVAVETDGGVIDEAQLGGRQGRLMFAGALADAGLDGRERALESLPMRACVRAPRGTR